MELNSKEKEKYLIIKSVVDGNITKQDAEVKLGITRRQVNRLIKVLLKAGENGFIHKK